MVIVDTSAIVAVLKGEPEWAAILDVMRTARRLEISAGSWLELHVVMVRAAVAEKRPASEAVALIDGFVRAMPVKLRIGPVTRKQGIAAASAFVAYGKGRGAAPAALNYGDCFSYALAKDRRAPLLFVGADFAKTDVRAALMIH